MPAKKAKLPKVPQIDERDARHHALARHAAPQRGHRAALRESVSASGRDDPVGAMHRRTGEPGHPRAVPAISGRGVARQSDHERARAADSVDRLFPRQVEGARRHGARGRRAARRRDSGNDGRAHALPGVGRKTANVGARPCARRSRACLSIVMCCVSPIGSVSRGRTIRSSSSSSCALRSRPRTGRGASDALIFTAGGSASRDRCATAAPCGGLRVLSARRGTRAAALRERSERSKPPLDTKTPCVTAEQMTRERFTRLVEEAVRVIPGVFGRP